MEMNLKKKNVIYCLIHIDFQIQEILQIPGFPHFPGVKIQGQFQDFSRASWDFQGP